MIDYSDGNKRKKTLLMTHLKSLHFVSKNQASRWRKYCMWFRIRRACDLKILGEIKPVTFDDALRSLGLICHPSVVDSRCVTPARD